MTTLKERFENEITKWENDPYGEESIIPMFKSFFRQELLALAEEVENAQANGEAVSDLIRSKADELN